MVSAEILLLDTMKINQRFKSLLPSEVRELTQLESVYNQYAFVMCLFIKDRSM